MAEASRRAARPPGKGGLANTLFVVGPAGAMPPELRGAACLVTIALPWGSLLRGCVGLDAGIAAGILGLLAANGKLELILAPAERDHLAGVPTDPAALEAAVRGTFEAHRLVFVEARPVTVEELRASGSSWARRLLREGRDRQATLIRFTSP